MKTGEKPLAGNVIKSSLPISVSCRTDPKQSRGFTLIELMIAVAIIGILTAIAYPNYQSYLIKSNRSAAQQFMLSVSNMQEQYLLDNRSYADDIGAGGLGMTVPSDLTGKYSFSLSGVSTAPLAYQIVATAEGGQIPDGNLTLDNAGAKTPVDKW